jgi:hypothetical protein
VFVLAVPRRPERSADGDVASGEFSSEVLL